MFDCFWMKKMIIINFHHKSKAIKINQYNTILSIYCTIMNFAYFISLSNTILSYRKKINIKVNYTNDKRIINKTNIEHAIALYNERKDIKKPYTKKA